MSKAIAYDTDDQYKRRNKEARSSIIAICDEEVDCREASLKALWQSAGDYVIRDQAGALMLSYKWLLDSVSYYKCLPCPMIAS